MGEPQYPALDFGVHKKCSRGWRTRSDSVLPVKHSLLAFQITRFSGTVRGDLWGASGGTFRSNPILSPHSKRNSPKVFLFVFGLLSELIVPHFVWPQFLSCLFLVLWEMK